MIEAAGTHHNAVVKVVRLKALDTAQRIIEGTATTPKTDRVGDIVMPLGAKFKLPLPLLLDHDHKQAVGEVEWASPTKAGIKFRARIAKIDEPGAAKDLVDHAWQLVESGLRKTVSIGFRSLPGGSELMADGGIKFSSWEWLELSLVAVPAQADATIDSFKAAPLAQPKRKTPSRVVALLTPAERQLKEGQEKLARLGKRRKGEADQNAGNGKRRAVVHIAPPAQREAERIQTRLREIEAAIRKNEGQQRKAGEAYDEALRGALIAVGKGLESERRFLLERKLGIENGLIDVSEKEVRAPLAKAHRPAEEATKPAAEPKAAPPRPWPSLQATDDGSAWDHACNFGMRSMQAILEKGGHSPDTVVRADTIRTVVGMAMGLATVAFRSVEALQAKVIEIEAAGIKFAGVWQRAQSYERGAIVTSAGSAWVALKEVPEGTVPGQSPEHWQLMVKAGRDGKDANLTERKGEARAVKL
ncbi:hypothetical protein [Devosia sp. XK-2]|uniref:hypothetical protein n=1 Tax=Devosia sp. XK-2 TaxID=3126689 RepID=UPI0030CB87FA